MNQEREVYEYCLDIWNYWEKKQLKRLEVIASGDQAWVRGRDCGFHYMPLVLLSFVLPLNYHICDILEREVQQIIGL